MPTVAFGDVAIPDRREPSGREPAQVGADVRVIPEHVRAQITGRSGPSAGPDNGQEVATRADPLAYAGEQCLLIGERDMDQGVEGNHRVHAGGPETERGHVSLDEPGRGDELVSAPELDG